MTTPRDFAIALLSGLGLPLTQNNLDAMVSAQAAEGGFMSNSATYNPLNVTQTGAGSRTASGFGAGTSNPANIQAYPDWPTGLSATIALFNNGLYKDILASFQASAAPAQTLAVWAKNPAYGWVLVPAVNTAYGAESFPEGPSTKPLPMNVFASAVTAQNALLGASIVQAGFLGVLAYGFWKLYEYLGKH